MMFFIILIHAFVCIALITLVLIQKGRGGGLVDTLSGVESMFGTKTPAFLTRTTSILSVLFFLSCLSLAVLSLKQSKSLMKDIKSQSLTEHKPAVSQPEEGPVSELPKPEEKTPVQPETPTGPEGLQEEPETE